MIYTLHSIQLYFEITINHLAKYQESLNKFIENMKQTAAPGTSNHATMIKVNFAENNVWVNLLYPLFLFCFASFCFVCENCATCRFFARV